MLNQLIIKTMPLVPKAIIKKVASKYIAGPTLADAVRVTKELEAKGGMTTIDVLGEFVETKERALHEMGESSIVLDAIYENKLKTYLSVKPTSLGLGIDTEFGYNNILSLLKKAAEYGIFIRLDMENSPYTTKTLDLYRRFRSEGFNNVGIVIQSYMIRSMDDVRSLIPLKPSVRLCKGIYKEAPSIAYQGKNEVRDNWKKLFDVMIENGFYVGIATHDDPLIDYARNYISKHNLPKESYEFQMLLGVREGKRNELLAEGHRLRVYTPFGEDWYGYSTRRLKENPDIAGQIFKSIFIKN
jgi:proline dehydrogenase